jgi:hypothetical protein
MVNRGLFFMRFSANDEARSSRADCAAVDQVKVTKR